ncbi:Dolichyl-diphosphooligosaccharide--protein glycosyltransferase subunit 1 [Grifola frondosa]|uniref:Dolichyl-diphosphooligosaccharide--protein glycosyltransferase subunit 1 n=1 Tax=Grifola frondosa TaxID=5627 RepID=A0A1C7M5M7_GRIFR|nr:Dolichyl-diphosphooligosaccharide--protein glycosyltransferase subunit 1 [Grifola frondosa]
MARSWRCHLSFILLGSLFSSALAANTYENTAIVRTVELGGALVHVTTTYAVKALEDGSSIYTIALGEQEHGRTSWLEAKIKGQSTPLPLEDFGYHPESGVYLYTVELPGSLNANTSTNLKDPQSFKYEAELLVLSPYKTAVQRTKIKSPSPAVHSYTTPEGLDDFTTDSIVTKSGATITYGPYYNIPPSATTSFVDEKQRHIAVHYGYDYPVLEVTKLERAAEISHWGANLNIQDNIHLHNAGPKLKGHFSRLEHQSQSYFGRASPQMLPALALHLPAGIHSV